MRTLRSDPFAPLVVAPWRTSTTPRRPRRRRRCSPSASCCPARPCSAPTPPTTRSPSAWSTHGRVDLDHDRRPARRHRAGRPRRSSATLVFDDPGTGELVTGRRVPVRATSRDKLDAARAAAAERPDACAVNVRRAARTSCPPRPRHGRRRGAPRRGLDRRRDAQPVPVRDPRRPVNASSSTPAARMWEVDGNRPTASRPPASGAPTQCPRRPVVEARSSSGRSRSRRGRATARHVAQRRGDRRRPGEGRRAAGTVRRVGLGGPRARATGSLADYNRRFNALVLRDYTTEGARLTLPGLARTFDPRPAPARRRRADPRRARRRPVPRGRRRQDRRDGHGRDGAARLGMVAKPAVVVPNHMLEQFSREWLQLYPQARLLAASTQGPRRRRAARSSSPASPPATGTPSS